MNAVPSASDSPPLPGSDSEHGPRTSLAAAVFVGILVFVTYFLAARQIAPGWDEGYTWERIYTFEPWFTAFLQPSVDVRNQFTSEMMFYKWPFSREEPDGHGPFYALLSFVGHVCTRSFLSELMSYRIGSITLFAVACAALFRTLGNRWGVGPASLAVILLATQPRLTPEICFGVVDGPLVSISILAFCGFLAALQRPTFWRIAAFGVPAGCALATKLTGWVLLGPYLAFLLLQVLPVWPAESKRFGRTAAVVVFGLLLAAATCFFLNVSWWHDPVKGIKAFFESNLTREKTTNIPIFFMGETYKFSLPWYNTIVWTVAAMSPGTMILGVLGVIGALWRRTPESILALLIWLAIMVVRALPQAPGHDGVRQLIIGFAFLSILSGEGAILISRLTGRWLAVLAGLAAVGFSTYENVLHHPVQLSYYSPAVGGLTKAHEKFEPTYFWDAMSPEAIQFLNDNTRVGQSILFSTNPKNWVYMHRWGVFKYPPHNPQDGMMRPKWYVLQHRTAMLKNRDRWLIEKEQPAFRVSKFGVPLVSIYTIEQYNQARRDAPSDES